MSRSVRTPGRWRSVPTAASLAAVVLLLAGLGVIFQNERTYQTQTTSETMVQAEILAASVTASHNDNVELHARLCSDGGGQSEELG